MGRQSRIRKLRREGKLPRVKNERKTPVWAKVLITILIFVLVLGSASAVWGYIERNVAARVGEETITIDQINSQLEYYRNLYSQFGMTLTAQQEEQLKENILQNLIEESLLVQYAKDHNLKYDEEQYKKDLQQQIDQTIEQGKKNNGEQTFLDLVNGQYGSLEAYKQKLEKVYGPYVERPLLVQAALDEKYKDISVTDEEIRQYFNSVKEISAEHLLVLNNSEISNPKQLADEIYKEINEKKRDKNFNFAQYAQEKVKEVNGKNNGKEILKYENLGYFSKGQMVKEFEDACFDPNVKIGDIIGPVKTQFGYHIIHILGKKTVAETYDQPEKVNVRIVQFNFDPNDENSKESAFISARSISVQTKKGMSFIDAVKRFSQDEETKQKDGETGFFSRDERPAIFDAVIKLNKGGITDPILVGNSYVVAQLIDKQPAKKATLDDKEVYDKVKEEILNNKKEEVKKQFINELKKTYRVRTTNPGRVLAKFFRKYVATPFNNFSNWISTISKPVNNSNEQNQNTNSSTEPLEPVNPSSGS